MSGGLDPAGTVVAVTGATSGIGRGIALALAEAGAHVVAIGRRRDLGVELEQEARGPGSIGFVTGDMTRPFGAAALVGAALERHGRLDVLVNNVGGVGEAPLRALEDMDLDWWYGMVDLNLTSVLLACQAARELLIRSHGVVVTIGSGAGQTVGPDLLAYRALKAAAMHLSRCIAARLGPEGVRVHTLAVHSVETEGGERVLAARTAGLDADATATVRSARAAVAVSPRQFGEGIVALLRDPTLTRGPAFEVV